MLGTGTLLGFGIYDGNELVYSKMVMPLIHKTMDGEKAHNFAIKMVKYGFVPRKKKFNNEEILVYI